MGQAGVVVGVQCRQAERHRQQSGALRRQVVAVGIGTAHDGGEPLKAGESVPITLVVEGKDGKKESIEVKAPVRALGAAQDAHKH